jgi:hypothetical protein
MVRVVRTIRETFGVASAPTVEELEKDWLLAWPKS